ncbi:MAG: radical SAM protein [Clostridia bacterium]|nr:radical SAM protein [Clostridia bacterium]
MNNLCNLCPNNCNVNRREVVGYCKSYETLKIAKYYLHPFEEPPVSGKNGSGTVFFTGCSLRCRFCQNFEVSRNLRGKEISVIELADIFKELETLGAHNINLVNPTHYTDKIIEAFNIYKPDIPIVVNTHGYERIETLCKLNPYVDVYLPDMKYYSEKVSDRYTGKKDYFKVAKEALEFMIESKPKIYQDGLIKQGVIVRHLILPLNTDDSKHIIDWFTPFKDKATFSLMSQYTPFGDIDNYPELKRKITKREYRTVLDYALTSGLSDMFVQDFESADTKYIPNWDY